MAPRVLQVAAEWLLLDLAFRGEERPAGAIRKTSIDDAQTVLCVAWSTQSSNGRANAVTFHHLERILSHCSLERSRARVVRADPAPAGVAAVDLLVDVEGEPAAERGIPKLGRLWASGFEPAP